MIHASEGRPLQAPRSTALQIAGLLLLALLPVLPSLDDPFIADDYLHITRLEELRSGSLERALRSWTLRAEDCGTWWTPDKLRIEYLRPLITATFWIDHILWGLQPVGYRLTNLLLHASTLLLCLALARRILGPGLPAWAAAAFFALHPCHTEAVLWVSARTDLVAALLYCAAFLLHLRSRPLRPSSAPLLAGALLCFTLALFSKEMAVTLPALLLLWNLLYPENEPLRRRLVAPALAAVLLVLYSGFRFLLFEGLEPPPYPLAHRPGEPDFLWHVGSGLVLYFADLVLFVPVDAAVAHPFWTRHWPWLLVLAALVLAALVSAIRSAPERGTRWLGSGWALLTLVPVLPAALGERYLYLPSVGYCILIGARLPRSAGALSGRERRMLLSLLALLALITLGKTLFLGFLSVQSRKPIDQAVAELDSDPGPSLLLIVDLPVTSALAFPHPIRLERAARPVDVEVLSIASDVLATHAGSPTSVECLAPNRLVLRRKGSSFLETYAERAFLGDRAPFRPGDVVERPRFSVRILEASDGLVHAFEIRLHRADLQDTLILQGQGFDLQRVEPVCGGTESDPTARVHG
jgi:hypothetical protein